MDAIKEFKKGEFVKINTRYSGSLCGSFMSYDSDSVSIYDINQKRIVKYPLEHVLSAFRVRRVGKKAKVAAKIAKVSIKELDNDADKLVDSILEDIDVDDIVFIGM
jgi:hypothetical protein